MGAPYNSFTFDNINSLTEGVYISGSSAFNAPERDVEMIVIPGRNGEFIRDNGRFNNIEVTYPCGVVGDSTDFKTKMQNIRNKLASKRGYCRLVDTYNPNEYRMGVFKDAIEVEPVAQNTAGEFEVVFNCKPQRYLISGETKTTVTSGSTVTNPTQFDAQPMIMTKGYGTLTVNGYEIEITNETLGNVVLVAGGANTPVSFDTALVNSGDDITINSVGLVTGFGILPSGSTVSVTSVTPPSTASYSVEGSGYNTKMNLAFSELAFDYGTSKTVADSWVVSISITRNGTTTTQQLTISLSVVYNGSDKFTFNFSYSGGTFTNYIEPMDFSYSDIVAVSTVSTLGNPTYIDCELGEVYKIENGSFISLNRLTDLGSNLPVLSPGENEITFDNTFTSVEIIPHWWVV